MKYAATILMTGLLITGSALTVLADDIARDFIEAIEVYKAGDYPKAIETLTFIASKGIENGHLYYNLGNAHLKNGDVGRAILWYERATRLLPNDPDLQFNYDHARALARDAGEEETAALVRIFFFWNYRLGRNTIITLAIAFNALFWTLAIAWRVTGRPGFRMAMRLALIPAVVFVSTALFNYHDRRHNSHAIVLPEAVSVRSGLEKTSTELFVLHAGARVKIVKSRDGYDQIRYSPEKIGWVPTQDLGRI